ncbi:hypothetical protein CYLTODRAFT_420157 [Cylindrobasidium torrendii FP15055 ss-10]|uniref:F-box domain-containing protein n=1 Tax=Cylindrobasidium torrendii FP15055 ss-10 TaxID=1314674 RepID=A0A0D7BIL0_9AGAR|nr:hypothetical protein CYLTODRAFT_420157 [Cylindrobasidium torrendii FP15055 ss-10]
MSVDKLPVEIMVEIFRHCIVNPVAASERRKQIGSVNKTWRRLLYTTRSIWSTIHFESRENGVLGSLDSRFDDLDLCLALSYPLPLDITIVVDIPNKLGQPNCKRPAAHCQALLTISGHADRWRDFSIEGCEWVFEYLPPLHHLEHSTFLRTFAARITDASDCKYYWDNEEAQVSLPNVTRFETNFGLLAGVSLTLTNLVTLTAGFDNIKQCHQMLAKTIHLTELTLIHVGTSTHDTALNVSNVLSVTSVRTLRLTKCGLAWVHFFSFPSLESLMLLKLANEMSTTRTPCTSATRQKSSAPHPGQMRQTLFPRCLTSLSRPRPNSLVSSRPAANGSAHPAAPRIPGSYNSVGEIRRSSRARSWK